MFDIVLNKLLSHAYINGDIFQTTGTSGAFLLGTID